MTTQRKNSGSGRGLRCALSRHLIIRTLDNRELPSRRLSRHLSRCDACATYWRNARRLEAALRLPVPPEIADRQHDIHCVVAPRLIRRITKAAAVAACLALIAGLLLKTLPTAQNDGPTADEPLPAVAATLNPTTPATPAEAALADLDAALGYGLDEQPGIEKLTLPLRVNSIRNYTMTALVDDLGTSSIEQDVVQLKADSERIGRTIMSHIPINIKGMMAAIE